MGKTKAPFVGSQHDFDAEMKDLIEQWERESKSWQEIANNMKDHDKTLSERSQTRSETYHICAQQLKKAVKKQENE